MKFEQRKDKILSLLDINDTLTIQELITLLGTSPATARRDVAQLESMGCLERYWGGIRRPSTPTSERQNDLKYQKTRETQSNIGRIAAAQLRDNELIFIGSGMTTLAMIPYIERKNLQVVTNGIPQLEALHRQNIPALLLCGFFKEYSRSLVGKETIDMLRGYSFDRAFLGAHGVDEKYSPLSADNFEDTIKTICIRQSRSTYLLVGKEKFHRTAFYSIPPEMTSDVFLITDAPADDSSCWEATGKGYIARIGDLKK